MTIEEKYLELHKKSVNRKNTDQNLAYTSRCLKEEISHKMC